MREIKFRAWSRDSGCWLTDEEVKAEFAIEPTVDGAYVIDCLSETTLCQYTGLEDKNGKEIYEGDIIPIRGIWGGDTITQNGVVEHGFHGDPWFDDNAYGWSITGSILQKTLGVEGKEVIGNIYENKELLDA